MKHSIRRAAALLLTAAVACSALAMTACGDNSSAPKKDQSSRTPAYTPYIPDSRIDESVPGTVQDAGIGDTLDYNGKVSVTLHEVVEMDAVNKQNMRVLMARMTITNNTDQPLDCSTLTHFRLIVDDGEPAMEPISDVQAAVAVRKYFAAQTKNLESFNQAIQPGQSLEGYSYIGAPTKWEKMVLQYTPYKYFSNDTLCFALDETQFVHYSNPL